MEKIYSLDKMIIDYPLNFLDTNKVTPFEILLSLIVDSFMSSLLLKYRIYSELLMLYLNISETLSLTLIILSFSYTFMAQ